MRDGRNRRRYGDDDSGRGCGRWRRRCARYAGYAGLFGLAVILCACLAGGGCAPLVRYDLSYAEGTFTVAVSGQMCRTIPVEVNSEHAMTGVDGVGEPFAVAATVTFGPPADETGIIGGADGLQGRDVSVTFTAPPALAGITVVAATEPVTSSSDGHRVTTVRLGDLTVSAPSGGAYDGLLVIARACLPVGDIVRVTPGGGTTANDTGNGHGLTVGEGPTVTVARAGEEQQLTFPADAGEGATPCHIRYTHEAGWLDLRVVRLGD